MHRSHSLPRKEMAMPAKAANVIVTIIRHAALPVCLCGIAWSIELPAETFADLNSEEFRKRESAQGKLLEWARGQGEPAVDALFHQFKLSSDPEVRDRCLGILRDLVNDRYQMEGKGWVGIRMLPEIAKVPGDPRARSVIRVTEVLPDSAALAAGLQVNDLIAGLEDDVWHLGLAVQAFSDKIQELKPGTKVKLKILRDGKLLDLEMKLGKRPLHADNRFLQLPEEALEAAEREAKETYFREWLERKKARK
jgi:predicted metalloprotease with PDZ domain